MADTLLTIVQKAMGRIGSLGPPAMVVGNPDDIVQTMFYLAQEEGEELVRAGDWSGLLVEGATLTLVPGQEYYPLPPDCDRLIGETQWDRTNKWRTLGPDDPQTARWRREGIVPFGPRRALRQAGGSMTVWPIPGTGDAGALLAFDYMSTFFCASGPGVQNPNVPQSAWVADTDVPLLRADLMVLGLKWRWRLSQGLEASVQRADYDRAVRLALARDKGGGETIDLAATRRTRGRGNADDVFAQGPSVALSTDGGTAITPD